MRHSTIQLSKIANDPSQFPYFINFKKKIKKIKKYLEFPNLILNLARSQIHIQSKIRIISKNIEHPSKFDKIDSLSNRTDILLPQEVNMFNKTKKKDFQRLLKLQNFTSYSSDSPRAAMKLKIAKSSN